MAGVILLASGFAFQGCRTMCGNRQGDTPEVPEGEFAVERVSPATREIVVPFYMRRVGPGQFQYRVAGQEEWLDKLPAKLRDPASGKFFPPHRYEEPLARSKNGQDPALLRNTRPVDARVRCLVHLYSRSLSEFDCEGQPEWAEGR